MKNTFEQIAQKYNGELNIEKKRIYGFDSIPTTMIIYRLTILYQNHEINIENELRYHNLGTFNCTFLMPQNFEFKTVERGYFSKILNPKADILSIKSNSSRVKNYIETQPSFKKLNELIKIDHQFEPTIIGKNTSNGFEVSTEYWLAFDSREAVLEPLIDFYKMLIDYLK